MTMKGNTIALGIIVMLIAAAIAIPILFLGPEANGGEDVTLLETVTDVYEERNLDTPDAVFQEANGGGDVTLLKAAHNAYDEGAPDTPLQTLFSRRLLASSSTTWNWT